MSNINNIIKPVLNGRIRDSRIFAFQEKGMVQLTISVNADRNLTLKLYQSYDGENFDKVNTREYLASEGAQLYKFDKQGVLFYFELANNSGDDCSFTRAYADFNLGYEFIEVKNTVEVKDEITRTELQQLNNNINELTQQVINLQKHLEHVITHKLINMH